MILLKLEKITNLNILKEIYNKISDYKLLNQIFISYKADIQNKSYMIENLIYNVLEIDLNDFESINKDEIEDIIYDLIELNTNILFVKNNISETLKKDIENICSELGLNYRYSDEEYLNKDIDLGVLTINDLYTIYEIYQLEPPNLVTFSPLDFYICLNVDNSGVVTHNNVYFDTLNDNFMDIIANSFKLINKNKPNDKDYVFKNCLYEPWALLNNDKDIEDKIENYKNRIFEKIKNIKPEEYPFIDKEIINLLNHFEYIQFNDVLEIISGKDNFLKYYK